MNKFSSNSRQFFFSRQKLFPALDTTSTRVKENSRTSQLTLKNASFHSRSYREHEFR